MEIYYNPMLITASIMIAMVAAFTALRITSDIGLLEEKQKKTRVVQGAFALGGGIWSMHFVGMLSITMPVEISYAPLPTLGSALIAILVVGAALLSLHFGIRNRFRIILAGVLTGLGIVSMHYLGMSAISENCIVTNEPLGILIATSISILVSTAALNMAYGERSLKSAILGGVILGLAISSMHYSAIFYTAFSFDTSYTLTKAPVLGQEMLAILISIASFIIFGVFLLQTVNVSSEASVSRELSDASHETHDTVGEDRQAQIEEAKSAGITGESDDRIPYTVNKAVRFISASAIFAVRADGHYTSLFNGDEELFCPLSISKLEEKLNGDQFIRSHRSYLVNLAKIHGFRREGDKGFILLEGASDFEVPVSRGRLPEIKKLINIS